MVAVGRGVIILGSGAVEDGLYRLLCQAVSRARRKPAKPVPPLMQKREMHASQYLLKVSGLWASFNLHPLRLIRLVLFSNK